MTDDGSPWRRGATNEPVIEVDVQPNRGTKPVRATPSASPGPIVISTEPDAVTEPPLADPDRRPQWVPAAIVGSVLALVIVAALVFGGGDSDEPDESTPTTPTETMPAPTTVPADEPEDDPVDDVDEPDDGANRGDDSGEEGTGGTTDGALPIRVDLPPVLAQQTTPTEIVAVTTDGRLVTVSIPSGTVRVERVADVPAGNPQQLFFEGALVVSPSAAAVGVRNSIIAVADREGGVRTFPIAELSFDTDRQPREVFPVGWVRAEEGTESFVLHASDFQGWGQIGFLENDGSVEFVGPDEAGDLAAAVLGVRFAEGVGYFGAGGQVYRYDANGEISDLGTGEIVTVANIGPVIRRCDETSRCTAEIVRSDGIAPIDSELADQLTTGFDLPFFAPNGQAVATIEFGPNGPELVLAALDSTTAERRLSVGGFPLERSGWVADGSGVVMPAFATVGIDSPNAVDDGIRFVPLDPDAAPVTFAEELGPIALLDTRFPDEELPPPDRSTTAPFERSESAARLPAVVAADRSGDVYRIDFELGEVVRVRTGLTGAWTNGRPAQVITLGESVVVIDRVGEDGLELLPDGTTTRAPSWPEGLRYAYDDERAWVSAAVDGGAALYRPVARDGTTVDGAISVVATEVIGTNGAGGLLHEYAGDVWLTDGTTTQRITTGELLALNGEQMIVNECDERQRCQVVRVLPTTGTRRTLETTTIGSFAAGADAGRDVALTGTLSPDGRTALVELDPGRGPDPASGWAFVDLQGDAVVPTGPPADGQPVVWSADSSTALIVVDGELRVFDRSAGTIEAIDGFENVVGLGAAP